MYGGLTEREREEEKRGRGVTDGLLPTGDNRNLRARLVQPLIVSVGVRGLMVGGLEILCAWRTCSEAQNQSHAESMYAYLCERVRKCIKQKWLLSLRLFLAYQRCNDALKISPVNSVTRDQSAGYSESFHPTALTVITRFHI